LLTAHSSVLSFFPFGPFYVPFFGFSGGQWWEKSFGDLFCFGNNDLKGNTKNCRVSEIILLVIQGGVSVSVYEKVEG